MQLGTPSSYILHLRSNLLTLQDTRASALLPPASEMPSSGPHRPPMAERGSPPLIDDAGEAEPDWLREAEAAVSPPKAASKIERRGSFTRIVSRLRAASPGEEEPLWLQSAAELVSLHDDAPSDAAPRPSRPGWRGGAQPKAGLVWVCFTLLGAACGAAAMCGGASLAVQLCAGVARASGRCPARLDCNGALEAALAEVAMLRSELARSERALAEATRMQDTAGVWGWWLCAAALVGFTLAMAAIGTRELVASHVSQSHSPSTHRAK